MKKTHKCVECGRDLADRDISHEQCRATAAKKAASRAAALGTIIADIRADARTGGGIRQPFAEAREAIERFIEEFGARS